MYKYNISGLLPPLPERSSVPTARTDQLEQTLQDVSKEVEAFKKKEVMHLEEMKKNAEKLNELTATLEAAVTQLEVRGHSVGQTKQLFSKLHPGMLSGSQRVFSRWSSVK